MAIRSLWKCDFCRSQKSKCWPPDRIWPGQRCSACERRGLSCGPNIRTRDHAYKKTRAAHRSASSGPAQGTTPATSATTRSPLTSTTTSIFMLPYNRNFDFTGRELEVLDLEEMLCGSDGHCRAAMMGDIGIGKSQIAIEFAYRTRTGKFDQIFWLRGWDCLLFEKDCHDALVALEIAHDSDGEVYKNAPAILHNYLESERNAKWLVIIDGVRDLQLYSLVTSDNQSTTSPQPRSIDLLSFVPQCRHGSLLMTTTVLHAAKGTILASVRQNNLQQQYKFAR